MGRDILGDNDWKTARKKLLEEFANIVGFDLNREAQSRKEITDSAVVPILAGFFP